MFDNSIQTEAYSVGVFIEKTNTIKQQGVFRILSNTVMATCCKNAEGPNNLDYFFLKLRHKYSTGF